MPKRYDEWAEGENNLCWPAGITAEFASSTSRSVSVEDAVSKIHALKIITIMAIACLG